MSTVKKYITDEHHWVVLVESEDADAYNFVVEYLKTLEEEEQDPEDVLMDDLTYEDLLGYTSVMMRLARHIRPWVEHETLIMCRESLIPVD